MFVIVLSTHEACAFNYCKLRLSQLSEDMHYTLLLWKVQRYIPYLTISIQRGVRNSQNSGALGQHPATIRRLSLLALWVDFLLGFPGTIYITKVSMLKSAVTG